MDFNKYYHPDTVILDTYLFRSKVDGVLLAA